MGSWSKKKQRQVFLYVATLKNCAKKKDLQEGTRLHAEIRTSGLLANNAYLGSTLISMYSKCGALNKARDVFHELPIRKVCTWNALLSGYTQQGLGKEALHCFFQMQSDRFSPDAFTYACILKACGITKAVNLGEQIHDEIVTQGLLGVDVVLGNALVDMYAKCGVLTRAQEVLDELPVRNGVSWTALITAYAQQDQSEKAMVCYDQMRHEGISPDPITYTSILKAYGIAKEVDKGKQIYEEIARQGLLGQDAAVGNALVDMYAKCGALSEARIMLGQLPFRNVVSWSALIVGYVERGQGAEAISCYEDMRQEGHCPNEVTYICILKACGIAKNIDKGQQIHEEIASQGLLGEDVLLGNALIDMYAKCGVVTKSQQVLDELSLRDLVSWNAVITGYAQLGQSDKAMLCYDQMRHEGLSPDTITYVCILKACSLAKDVGKGKQIHEEVASQGRLRNDILLGNALIDMYTKCGMLTKARQVLDELPIRDIISWSTLMAGYAQEGQCKEAQDCFDRMQSEGLVPNKVSWNTLIGGYTQQGEGEIALGCFERMQKVGIAPDASTLVCVLNACSHSGLVAEGQRFFDTMKEEFGIIPDLEHFVCMINLFGRVGHFDKAMALIKQLRPSNYLVIWSALLGTCRKWGNVNLGRLAFEHAISIDCTDATAYICMEDIYAAAGMGEEAQEIQSMRVKNAAWMSTFEVVGGAVQRFVGKPQSLM